MASLSLQDKGEDELSLREPLLSSTNGDSSVMMMEQERQQRHNSVLLQTDEASSLLLPNNNENATASCAVAWPLDAAAERVRLLVPEEYKTRPEKQQGNELYCHLRYDSQRHLLLVVMKGDDVNEDEDHEEETLIDVINSNDLIGADISLEFAAAISEAASPSSPTNDASSPRDDNDSGSESDENENNDGTTTSNPTRRRATNEPPSDSLHDHRGHALLTLYVYPRRNPKDATLLQWMGITSPATPPSPPPRQSVHEFFAKYDNEKEQQEALMQGQPRYAHFRKFQLAPAEDLGDSSRFLAALRRLAAADASSSSSTTDTKSSNNNNNNNKKKYLIIVNPKSGPKKNGATIICHTLVEPMLQQAGIETHTIITTHARHAQELMSMNHSEKANDDHGDIIVDVSNYNGIVLMGGDGIIFEVLNGIMARPDAHDILQNKITLGIVGCGSCNGLAATIMHESQEALNNSVINQVFVIAKGYNQVCMDISRYQTTPPQSTTDSSSPSYYYSFLTFAYGMIADIDIESELLHCLGEVRVDIWAVWRVLFLRRYRARFSYLPPPPTATTTNASSGRNLLPDSLTDPLTPNGVQGWKTLSSSNSDSTDDDNDGIILFWASQVSHAAMHTHQAPDSHLQDGLFKVMIVRNSASRFQVARILLGLESGSHVNMPGVEFIDCIAYRLEPLDQNDNGRKELNVLDGEVIESGPIQAQVLPSMVRIFCDSKSYIVSESATTTDSE